jgi:hypothetical protein
VAAIVIIASDQQQLDLLVDRELDKVLEGSSRRAGQPVATCAGALAQASQRAV